MKKILSMVLAAVMCATMMVGCGGSQKPAETDSSKEQQSVEAEAKPEEKAEVEEKSEETQKPSKTADPNKKDIKFGITSSFRDFTDYIPEKMAQWGYNVEIIELDSPVVANTALVEGSVDVNYIQHLPYLLAYNESNGTKLHPCKPYIMSSMDCIASKKYKTLEEVPDGASIAVADDASNLSVNLQDLESIGWLKLKEIPEGSLYTTFDIVENPKNLQLVEMDMFSRFSAMEGDVDLAMSFFSNTSQEKYNFNLLKLFDENIAYPQVVAVREEDKDAQWVKDFMDAFTSQEQVDRINEKNTPTLSWKILFEVKEDSASLEKSEEKSRKADPNKTTIKLGVTPSFEYYIDYIPEVMGEWGYTVEVVSLDSPVAANTALAEGSIDVNYFQHLPYLLAFNESNGTRLHPCEPYIMSSMDCIASKKYKTLEEVPDGASIAVADDASNLSINLEDLQSIGWLKLKEIPEDSLYTTFDIIENPKNLQLVEMDMFSRFSAMDGDVDLAMSFFSNQSQAKYNFNLLKLFEENISYPIIAVVREEDKETQWVDDCIAALASETQLERIAEQNKPSLAWKVLFEVAE